MRDPKETVDTLRDKLKSSERGGSDKDREKLLEFSDELSLLRSEYSHYRHEKLLRHCIRISEHAPVDISDTLTDKAAAKRAVRWIHDQYDITNGSAETNRDYRVALRVFGRRVETADASNETPESISWISSQLPESHDPAPNPANMLTWGDIESSLAECRNSRDKAAISLQYDAGLRGGELFDLRVSDISDTEHGLQIRVDGKTGQRSIDLIPSTPHVNRWLDDHPGTDDSYLWTSLRSDTRLSYAYFLDMFKQPIDRAGIDKPATPTNFRKSNLAWLVKKNLNARLIEKRQCRQPGSEAVSRYFAVFDQDVGEQYARVMGKEIDTDDKDAQELAPLECPRCDKETPRDKKRCMWCGQALAHDVTETDTQDRIELAKALKDAEGETAENLQELIEFVERNPWVRDIARE